MNLDGGCFDLKKEQASTSKTYRNPEPPQLT